nr:hypothetical protein [uncultured Psychroserpens sp.]
MIKKMFLAVLALSVFATSCSDDDDSVSPIVPNAGTITGGPFTFIVDGNSDFVSGITTDSNAIGTNRSFVVTDMQGAILGLPPTNEALQGVDFDGAGVGTCLIWYLRYENGLLGKEVGLNINDLSGSFDLSNSITVNRLGAPNAGVLSGGPFNFVFDGTPDFVSGITTDSNAIGTNSTFVITDINLNILGAPATLEMLEGVNFEGAGRGVCLVWYLRYEDDTNLDTATNANDLTGTFNLSNSIRVERGPNADALIGGPFSFTVDGTPDMVSGIAFENPDNRVGTNSTWIITDDTGMILGTPPTLDAVEGVDFDGAGVGTCLIWYLRYENDTNINTVTNANELTGTFHLSNSITVARN